MVAVRPSRGAWAWGTGKRCWASCLRWRQDRWWQTGPRAGWAGWPGTGSVARRHVHFGLELQFVEAVEQAEQQLALRGFHAGEQLLLEIQRQRRDLIVDAVTALRSEERRVGQECVRTFESR